MWENKGPLAFVVFASGQGTNARALFDFAAKNPALVQARGLISDRAGVGALAVAKEFGVPAFVVPASEENELLELLKKLGATWALLAGYKRLVSERFLSFFSACGGAVLNVHPSLLPAYPGLGGYKRAFADGVSSGVTVHLVDAGLDTGPIVLQESFAREPQDSLESFEAKGRKLEWDLFPRALRMAAEGKIFVKGKL